MRLSRAVAVFAATALLSLPGCRGCGEPPSVEPPPSLSPAPSASPILSIAPEVALTWASVDLVLLQEKKPGIDVALALGGETVPIPGTDLSIRLEVFAPNFQMNSATQDVSSDAEAKNPAAKVTVTEKEKTVFEGWIFPFEGLDEWAADPRYDLRLKAWHRRTAPAP